MPVTGEQIRLQNYVDDVAATLRRITVHLPFMTVEEKRALADYMRKSDPNFTRLVEELEKAK